tara:strand:+ start:267 stop:488 length:222 start_codon:yes stop_codon:yes gene_type:complete
MDKFDLSQKIADFVHEQIENSDIELYDVVNALAATLAATAISSAKEGYEKEAILATAILIHRHGTAMIAGEKK